MNIPAEGILGAIKFNNQAQFNSRKYTLEVLKRVKKYGGTIYENSKVIDIKSENNKTTYGIYENETILTISTVESTIINSTNNTNIW